MGRYGRYWYIERRSLLFFWKYVDYEVTVDFAQRALDRAVERIKRSKEIKYYNSDGTEYVRKYHDG